MKIELNEKVMAAITTILESGVGYQINLAGDLLQLYQLHDLRFVVNRYEHNPESPGKSKWIYEELFDDAREAVEFFEQERRKYELGDDIEAALNEVHKDELNQQK